MEWLKLMTLDQSCLFTENGGVAKSGKYRLEAEIPHFDSDDQDLIVDTAQEVSIQPTSTRHLSPG